MAHMDQRVGDFIEANPGAAMVTLRADGTPHSARVGVGLVGGQLWSSGTQSRVRTGHLRRDPRCGLFVFDTSPDPKWLGLETEVTILDGPDAPELNLALMRHMQRNMSVPGGRISWFSGALSEEEFLETMRSEQRLIYQFNILRSYGYY